MLLVIITKLLYFSFTSFMLLKFLFLIRLNILSFWYVTQLAETCRLSSEISIVTLETTATTTDFRSASFTLTLSDNDFAKIQKVFNNVIYPSEEYKNQEKYVFRIYLSDRGTYAYFKAFNYGNETYRNGYAWTNIYGGKIYQVSFRLNNVKTINFTAL